jgi:CHAD domain-containing protein
MKGFVELERKDASLKTDLKTSLKTPSTRRFAQDHADRLLGHLAEQIARAAKTAGADEVHDLRVAIRRFKAVLKALNPCFPGREVRKIGVELRRIMSLAGEVRDRDIGVELLIKVSGPAVAPLVVRFETERVAAAKNLTDALEVLVKSRASSTWNEMLHKPRKRVRAEQDFCGCPVDVTATRLLPEIAEKHYKRGGRMADGETSARKLHRFRIVTKKFRYTLDLFAPLYGKSVETLAGELKHIQTLLGNLNDYATIRRMLRRMTTQNEDDAQAGEEVGEEIVKKRREKAAEFRDYWGKTFTGAKATQWISDLQRLARNGKTKTGLRP